MRNNSRSVCKPVNSCNAIFMVAHGIQPDLCCKVVEGVSKCWDGCRWIADNPVSL